ncbi:ABC transporter permease [Microvirga sp. Mcv34]|uniref:ABC transporter permease n=1 Tax=Microvirga sp. Mcv34 TaxID=2926016 RepID=UPI0021C68000|nr:proline/glycine betaine ABC transporter permease [Microvirga sp. Mcv34]
MDFDLSIGAAASAAVEYTLDNFSPTLDAIADVIGFFASGIKDALSWFPPWAFIGAVALFAFWRVGWKFAVLCGAALLLIVGMGLWKETIETLALVIAATAIAITLGIPLGIFMARSSITAAGARPLLDLMQTMPAFVYLIPAAMFFGLGAVPGTIATVIFSMPPVVRLTALGLTQVSREYVEAGLAFGCTDRQLLFKVQFPLALPSIMAGVNQTIMLGLSMVVIASMIGAGGLGNTVLTGIQRLDVGLGFEGGLAVVILAIILDRLTQSLSRPAAFKLPRAVRQETGAKEDATDMKTALAEASA